MTTVTCFCLRPMQRVPNMDVWNCAPCGTTVSGIELVQGIDPHSKMIQTVRSWWRANGVVLA